MRFFLVMPLSIGWSCCKSTRSHIPPVCKAVDFSASTSAHAWAKHGKKKTKLLTYQLWIYLFKKLNRAKQNAEEEAGSAAAANVHAGPSSDQPSICKTSA